MMETGRQLGVWLCVMPDLPAHLVQELNAGTVWLVKHNQKVEYKTSVAINYDNKE